MSPAIRMGLSIHGISSLAHPQTEGVNEIVTCRTVHCTSHRDLSAGITGYSSTFHWSYFGHRTQDRSQQNTCIFLTSKHSTSIRRNQGGSMATATSKNCQYRFEAHGGAIIVASTEYWVFPTLSKPDLYRSRFYKASVLRAVRMFQFLATGFSLMANYLNPSVAYYES